MEYDQYLVYGELTYKQKCANCHGVNGEGLKGLYPPLSNNSHLENTADVICIIKNGAAGKVEVNGIVYDQAMPANAKLYNLDIAQLVTYLNHIFLEKKMKVETKEVVETLEACK
ncbi:MAG: cytochrome c551 [Algoriphagus sp.]|jgi:cytochrome c551